MIKYQLTCAKNHGFEAWFRSSEDYDRQRKRRLVTCPSCGGSKVEKAIMAPSVVTSEKAKSARRKKAREIVAEQSAAAVPDTVATTPSPPSAQSLTVGPEQREILKRMRALRDDMLKSSDYVGPRFAEEARKMHEDDAPKRGIHGEASPDEVKSLIEDGIDVLPIPALPDDKN